MAIYCTTDLHGNYNIWKQIQNYLQEEDTLVFLGDAIDRGDRGFEIFKEMLEDDRVIFIRGNHEQMMYDAWFVTWQGAFGHWLRNGGEKTIDNMRTLGLSDEEKKELVKEVISLPCLLEYVNPQGYRIQLSHAGFTPNDTWDALPQNEQRYNLIWDRKHLVDAWPIKNDIIVHGHTPIQHLLLKGIVERTETGIKLEYAMGHKICLDMGTIESKVAVLFNLDTLTVEKTFIDN